MKVFAWIGVLSRRDLFPVAGVLLLLAWPGGTTAQELETPFFGLDAPTPRIPPAPVGTVEAPLQSPGEEGGEEEAGNSAFPKMAVAATLGSLAGSFTGGIAAAAYCQHDCDCGYLFVIFAAGWAGGTAGSAIGPWSIANEDGLSGGNAALASLVGGGAAILAGSLWGFPVVQGVTTAAVAELLRQ